MRSAAAVAVAPPGATTDEIHLWGASLRLPPPLRARRDASLSADERSRADRFRFARDRDRFVAARGLLRAILGGYLDRDPVDLRFAYGPNGKPSLADPPGDVLRFNLAHSGDHAVVAVGWGRGMGVDLEEIRADLDPTELGAVALTPGERALLAALPADRRPDVFAALWTRKEALAKASGRGLALPFSEVDVAVGGNPGQWACWEKLVVDGRVWSLRSLDAGGRFAAALAVEGDGAGIGVGVRWRERWPDGGDLPEG